MLFTPDFEMVSKLRSQGNRRRSHQGGGTAIRVDRHRLNDGRAWSGRGLIGRRNLPSCDGEDRYPAVGPAGCPSQNRSTR